MFVCYAQFHNSRVTPYFCADVFASERAVVCKCQIAVFFAHILRKRVVVMSCENLEKCGCCRR